MKLWRGEALLIFQFYSKEKMEPNGKETLEIITAEALPGFDKNISLRQADENPCRATSRCVLRKTRSDEKELFLLHKNNQWK